MDVSILEFLRGLRIRAITPGRVEHHHEIECPECRHPADARRIVVLACACGRVKLEHDFTNDREFEQALKARTERRGESGVTHRSNTTPHQVGVIEMREAFVADQDEQIDRIVATPNPDGSWTISGGVSLGGITATHRNAPL